MNGAFGGNFDLFITLLNDGQAFGSWTAAGNFRGFLLDKEPPPYNIKNLTQAWRRNAVKFRLEDIPPEGREEDFIEEPSWMDERFSGEKNRTFEFSGKILIHLFLRRNGRW